MFISLVNALFAARRRTIKNNLCQWLETNQEKSVDSILQETKIDPMARAEDLIPDDFIKLVNVIE